MDEDLFLHWGTEDQGNAEHGEAVPAMGVPHFKVTLLHIDICMATDWGGVARAG